MTFLSFFANILWDLFRAIAAIGLYFYKYSILKIPISFPGEPTAKPQKRRGDWPKRSNYFHNLNDWKFSCDSESHKKSQIWAPYDITGESCGRQIWYQEGTNHETKNINSQKVNGDESNYGFSGAENPNSADKVFRHLMMKNWNADFPTSSVPESAFAAAKKGVSFYEILQCSDGHWAGDYGGPMFLLPGLICVLYVTKTDIPSYKKTGMIAYLRNHQQTDGGWGSHIECASTMFGSVLSYVALRLLGVDRDEDFMILARSFIHAHGGALYAPSWAKFWLAVIGVYHWDGINSIPAEMWFLPRWFPFHPGKLWCHCRMVYLPMCYAYCKRFSPDVKSDPILTSLRKELYLTNYDSIDWDSFRQTCADIDQYSPLNPVMKVAQDLLSVYERVLPYIPPLRFLREKALEFVIKYIHAEDVQTNYVDIGPVNKCLNMLAVWMDGGNSNTTEAFVRHIPRIDDYIWVAEDGVKMQGYNGSQCWDTSFAVQGFVEGDLCKDFPECTRKVYDYLKRSQIANDEVDRDFYFRHISKGGWPFSTAAHGWPISDCTAEGLKAVLALHDEKFHGIIPVDMQIPRARLEDACDVLLSLQNGDGGWATYENNRGYRWFEMLNPSEVFGDIMIDYSYVECSSASVTALKSFSKFYPDYKTAEVKNSIQNGRKFIESIQRQDGSWYGSWGVCFIYGTWFGIEGLVATGVSVQADPIRRATAFLLGKQNQNGGWGENYLSCVNKSYPSDGTGNQLGDDGSGVVQTAWAVMGLLAANCEDHVAIKRGVDFIRRKQLPSGDWDQEGITGVFNRSIGITYSQYRNIFPIWALGRYANKYKNE